jgi:hypothetical protein
MKLRRHRRRLVDVAWTPGVLATMLALMASIAIGTVLGEILTLGLGSEGLRPVFLRSGWTIRAIAWAGVLSALAGTGAVIVAYQAARLWSSRSK